MQVLNSELDRLRAGADTISPTAIRELEPLIVSYEPIGRLPPETLTAVIHGLCEVLTKLSKQRFSFFRPGKKIFTPTHRVLVETLVRFRFRLSRNRRNLLSPDLLPESARIALDRAGAVLSDCESSFGETPSILYYKAAFEYCRQNIELAYALFDRVRTAFSSNYAAYGDQMGCFSIRKLSEIVRLANLDSALPQPATFVSCQSREFMLIACFDDDYLDRYGRRLLESLDPHENVALHLHVATDNPSRVTAMFPKCKNLSFEHVPAFVDKVPYYQSMRFLRMREFIDVYKRPLLFIDANMYFMRSPDALFKQNSGMHVGLNFNPGCFVPWSRYDAQQVYVDSGPESCTYARYLQNLFLHIYSATEAHNYWIDQAILAHAVEAARIDDHQIRFADNQYARYSGIQPQR